MKMNESTVPVIPALQREYNFALNNWNDLNINLKKESTGHYSGKISNNLDSMFLRKIFFKCVNKILSLFVSRLCSMIQEVQY